MKETSSNFSTGWYVVENLECSLLSGIIQAQLDEFCFLLNTHAQNLDPNVTEQQET